MNNLKAEFKKVFTIRSTYIILLIVVFLMLLFGFYISGWKISLQDLANPNTLTGDINGAVGTVSAFLGLIAILLMTHEYRYNTILHTFTLSNSRSKVIASKILVLTGIALIFTALVAILAPLLALAGLHAHHLHLIHQKLLYENLAWRTLFYGWGYTMAGLLLAVLIRNQIGAIIALFIIPGVIENLVGLILKNNQVYLPFSALGLVIGNSEHPHAISQMHAAEIFLGYLFVGWIVGWFLFVKRDAI